MATKRVTVSLPIELAEKLKERAGEQSVSSLVAEILEGHFEEVDEERFWDEYFAAFEFTDEELAQTDRTLKRLSAQARARYAA